MANFTIDDWLNEHDMKDLNWAVIHETLQRIWQAMGNTTPMPSKYDSWIIKNLDMNFKVIFFDLIKILEVSEGNIGKFVKLASDITQIIDSDIAMANGKKLLGVKKNESQANLVSVGDYGTYEQIEVGTESDPLCLNHAAKAPDGTVVGKNILVNYKDTAGANKADTVAYGSDIAAETTARIAHDQDQDAKIATLNGAYYVLDAYDFEKTLDVDDPDDVNLLNTYAIANTPGASSMADVYNDTVIINGFDTSEFVYNKISELWVKYPNGYLTIATNDHLGVVKGTQPPTDPTDETKDTYVQVLADGSMKLVGDRLGKINTVNGISPDTNKNVQTDYIYQTEADFEADKDNIPVGSTVIKMYEYPENKIYELNRPYLWPINTEIDFGNGLYGFRKVGVASGTAQVNIGMLSVAIAGSAKLISQGGYVTPENSTPSYVTAYPIPDFAKGFIIQDNAYGINLIIPVISSGNRTNAPYDVWVTYTK
jgi:hypothetical protein